MPGTSPNVIFPDTDTLSKLGKAGQLDLLLAPGDTVMITSIIQAEVNAGAAKKFSGVMAAQAWIAQQIQLGKVITDGLPVPPVGSLIPRSGSGEKQIVDTIVLLRQKIKLHYIEELWLNRSRYGVCGDIGGCDGRYGV